MNRKFQISLLLLAIVIALLVAVFYFVPRLGEQSSLHFPLKGAIYLTLTPTNGLSRIYKLDLATKSLSPYRTKLPAQAQEVTPVFSADGTNVALSYRSDTTQPFQLYAGSADGINMRQITSTPRIFKRELAWNTDGNIVAYTVPRTDSDLDYLIPVSWAIYIADLKGHSNYVARGVDPFFSPDGQRIFILQNDGIHAFDVAPFLDILNKTDGTTRPSSITSKRVEVIPGEKASQLMKISISPDHSHLAWSDYSKGVVRIYKIKNWKPFSLILEKEIPMHAYWSVFSPDGKYLAILQILNSQQQTYAGIVLYDLGSGATEHITDLKQFDLRYLWMTAWTN